jgi:hypothetical protein
MSTSGPDRARRGPVPASAASSSSDRWINQGGKKWGHGGRGLDGGAGRLPADNRRPRCADVCMVGNNPSATESGSPSKTRALPLNPVPKADEVASRPAGNERSAQMFASSCRPPGQPRSRLRRFRARRVLHRRTAMRSRWSCPRTSWPSILRNSSGPRLGVLPTTGLGSFGRELAVSPKENLRKPPEFGSMSQPRRLGGVATQRPAKPFTPVRFR